MSAGVKLAGFAALLAVSLGIGLAVGAVAGPVDTDDHPPAVVTSPIAHTEGHGLGG